MSNNNNDSVSISEPERESRRYRVQYRPKSGESIESLIVKTVATVTDTPPTDIDPLYNTIDPRALQTMYETIDDFPDYDGEGGLTFPFGGCTVTVYWNGIVEVEPDTYTDDTETT